MRLRGRSKINTYLDIAPLIDCVFLLLIFFLLTSSFIEQNGFEIDLPKAVFSSNLDDKNITIYVTPQEDIYMKGKRLKLSDLKNALSSIKKPVVIKADKDVRLGIVTKIMDIAKACNVGKLSIATMFDGPQRKNSNAE
ncbi:MAG: biopolymer transporter ExbD [Candidatus Margulisiibacteriota bacterium]|nr:biopolymer transporter ExbD [Candidatus Margulisiibacteriota bacterium]